MYPKAHVIVSVKTSNYVCIQNNRSSSPTACGGMHLSPHPHLPTLNES